MGVIGQLIFKKVNFSFNKNGVYSRLVCSQNGRYAWTIQSKNNGRARSGLSQKNFGSHKRDWGSV